MSDTQPGGSPLDILLRHLNAGAAPPHALDWSNGPLPAQVDGAALIALVTAWQQRAIRSEAVHTTLDALLHHPSRRLLVYGSLAPGERHDNVLATVRGQWQPAHVSGHIDRTGEYPSFTWQPEGPTQQVKCFSSPALPAHWPRLDAFEGDGYRRVWVTAQVAGALCVASIYHAAPGIAAAP